MGSEEIVQALREVLDAVQAEHAARCEYSGYDWEWHGRGYICDLARATKRFEMELNAVIDDRVQLALQKAKLASDSE